MTSSIEIINKNKNNQNLYLTKCPEITFFKTVFMKYTPFAIETKRLSFDNNCNFGNTCSVTLPKIGDLIYHMNLEITLPCIEIKRILNQTDIDEALTNYNTSKHQYEIMLNYYNINKNAFISSNKIFIAENIIQYSQIFDIINTAFENYDESIIINILDNEYNNNKKIYLNYKYVSLNHIKNNFINNDNNNKNIILNTFENAITLLKDTLEYFFKKIISNENKYNECLNDNHNFAWNPKIGHYIIDYIDINIGGERINRLSDDFININYELTKNKSNNKQYDILIGNVEELTSFNRKEKKSYTILVPLQFWFNKHSGMSLPLIALNYHTIDFIVKFKNFSKCGYIDNKIINLDDIIKKNKINLTANLLIDYVFIEKNERHKFINTMHEYLIEQVQYNIFEFNKNDSAIEYIYDLKLNFVNPCKHIFWTVQKNYNSISTKILYGNYSLSENYTGNPINNSILKFNSYNRFNNIGAYFNYVIPYEFYNCTPSDGINVYSFSLYPTEIKPSGSCNFSKIKSAILQLYIDKNIFIDTDKIIISVYAVNYNILVIKNGIGGLAYI
jgi:hypothetical protein